MLLEKNGMTFTCNPDGSFTCNALGDLPRRFEEYHGSEKINGVIADYVDLFRNCVTARFQSKEEAEATSPEDAKKIGLAVFETVVSRLESETASLTLFDRFLFWFGHWWYFTPELMSGVKFPHRDSFISFHEMHLHDLLLSILPDPVKGVVDKMKFSNVATGYGHFALLFVGEDQIRRIVTDTQLFELRGVFGYVYLDITPDGLPIARSRCDRGGERAFFDGQRLMSHDRFQTCAPKTIIIDGGYKVNSTKCTIVNGFLFDLIDVDDKVAHTTGAFMGITDFSPREHAAAIQLAAQSGSQMKVEDGSVLLAGKELKPRGMFAPSRISLLASGFALYDWSDFHEINSVVYDHVLVVDDNQSWIDTVRQQFGNQIPELDWMLTHSAAEALETILRINPDAVLLDMHFTSDERFEGLWIANQLAAQGFKGAVMITSSYGMEALRAMQKLIKMETVAPGKDVERLRRALYGKPLN